MSHSYDSHSGNDHIVISRPHPPKSYLIRYQCEEDHIDDLNLPPDHPSYYLYHNPHDKSKCATDPTIQANKYKQGFDKKYRQYQQTGSEESKYELVKFLFNSPHPGSASRSNPDLDEDDEEFAFDNSSDSEPHLRPNLDENKYTYFALSASYAQFERQNTLLLEAISASPAQETDTGPFILVEDVYNVYAPS